MDEHHTVTFAGDYVPPTTSGGLPVTRNRFPVGRVAAAVFIGVAVLASSATTHAQRNPNAGQAKFNACERFEEARSRAPAHAQQRMQAPPFCPVFRLQLLHFADVDGGGTAPCHASTCSSTGAGRRIATAEVRPAHMGAARSIAVPYPSPVSAASGREPPFPVTTPQRILTDLPQTAGAIRIHILVFI
jgi:hypothetical protein